MARRASTSSALPAGVAFAAVIVAALNLRAGIASVGPVLGDVLAAFGAAGGLAGVITAMPGAFFAVMGLSAVPLARRLGLTRTLTLGMGLVLVGLSFRPWVSSALPFIALTALVVAGIALANVLLPAWIKLHGGSHVVTLMTINGSLLGASGALGPLSAALYDGPQAWRHALFFWVYLGLAQVIVWLFVAWRQGFDFPGKQQVKEQPRRQVALWKAPTALFLTLFFGLQSMNAYSQMGYLPQILIDAGARQSVASTALAVVGGLGIVGGLVMPTLIDRAESLTPHLIGIAACAVFGYLGLILAPTAAPLVWSVFLGLGGWAFPAALTLIVARSKSPEVTARLSGFVQPFGYVIAALGPLLIGLVYSPEDPQWTPVLLALLLASVIQGLVGIRAARRVYIDDELARAN
ncbi:MFS transporter [Corynebacterium tapiri]|uniref:MFS transporter n=1 Tax=Corynebacterium tapiri TaxID=1448266 RepID=A0A5C4U6B8_9CORY|nr:MFS transporter [Corynebacterium tapiri]TNM00442.1 MFS transporter [Corynebacterium tapiri]